jgi:putative toxin-antitoxin system antitoxin component (TIGR02293 family)
MNDLKVFDPKKSIRRAKRNKALEQKWSITLTKGEYAWSTRMDRVDIIRKRLPYESIDVISSKANLPVKRFLQLLDMPQTTYNKRRKAQELLSSRDSEIVLVLAELLDYGVFVFNGETDKFYRWLKKPNISLGGITPESLFDSLTGIQEVKHSLTRLEFGNLA